MTTVTTPNGNLIRNGSAAGEQSRIQPVEVARDPNIKPGQEFAGYKPTLRQRSLDSSRSGPRRRARRESSASGA